eukprot:Lithocolla_globosa_v1_NODE_1455_length_2561_cov_332.847167.p2 type:complete len:120 gc:universal NODE_1455_length_2561_cov_332.847167:2017-2376(+)
MITRQTKGTNPNFLVDINLTERVQNSSTRLFASNRVIKYRGEIFPFFEGCVNTTYRNNTTCGLQSRIWPNIPTKSNSVLIFGFLERCHFFVLSSQTAKLAFTNKLRIVTCAPRRKTCIT